MCMCGLDEPPEFSLQLWTSLGGEKENERLEKNYTGRKSRS